MNQPTKFLIDGIDRLGKSTLVDGLLNELGYHLVVHYSKPKTLNAYTRVRKDPVGCYQRDCNAEMFKLISSDAKIIFDRTHLGEMVYAPLYRRYPGNYVYQYETTSDTSNSRLILLITSDFNLCVDDGESHNFDNKVIEQQSFLNAFCQSSIVDKIIVDVHDGKGKFKSPETILNEALKRSN